MRVKTPLLWENELKNWIWSLKNANDWKCRSFYCCLVAIYYFETILKNFGKWRHKGPLFHTSDLGFYKIFVILVFWNKNSPLAPILIMIDWKLGPIQGILNFSLTRNHTGNLQYHSSASLWKLTSRIKYKNWHNCGSSFDFELRFFFKVIFLEGVLFNKIKFHIIRCRSWSPVPI